MRETLEITDRSYVMRGGKVLCHGTPEEVLHNPEARKYYFGEGMDLKSAPAPSASRESRSTRSSGRRRIRRRVVIALLMRQVTVT